MVNIILPNSSLPMGREQMGNGIWKKVHKGWNSDGLEAEAAPKHNSIKTKSTDKAQTARIVGIYESSDMTEWKNICIFVIDNKDMEVLLLIWLSIKIDNGSDIGNE